MHKSMYILQTVGKEYFMQKDKLLIVDDEKEIADLISLYL